MDVDRCMVTIFRRMRINSNLKGVPQSVYTFSPFFLSSFLLQANEFLFFVGRFLQEYSADDILFGNTFDRPLKLPWGSGAALRFMK